MDKIFSTRIDEDLARQLDTYVKKRGLSKKSLVEAALRSYFKQRGAKPAHEILERTFGAWKRDESPEKTRARAREQFNKSFGRHQVTGNASVRG
jgi:hypothetical protein